MKISSSTLDKLIREEIKYALQAKDPADIKAVEDAWAGGEDLVSPFEFVPEDQPSDMDKPARREPIKENFDPKYSGSIVVESLQKLATIVDDLIEAQMHEVNHGGEDGDPQLFSDLIDSVEAMQTEFKNALDVLSDRGAGASRDDLSIEEV